MSATLGQPWHGRYTSDLTNGERLTVDRDGRVLGSADGIVAWDHTPDTLYIRRPDLTEPATPDAIAAAGGELRHYAIACGQERQLSPKAAGLKLGLGRWVYFDPAGVPWIMELVQPGSATPVTGVAGTTRLTGALPVTVRTLGRAGVLTPGHVAPAPLTVASLTLAVPGWHSGTAYRPGAINYTATQVFPSPAGDRATFRVSATSDDINFSWITYPALVQVTVSGTGGADGSGLSAAAAILYETPALANFSHIPAAWGYLPAGDAWRAVLEQETDALQWFFRLYLDATLLRAVAVDAWDGFPAFTVEDGIYGVWWMVCRYSNNTFGLVKFIPDQPFEEGGAVGDHEIWIDDIFGPMGESAAPANRVGFPGDIENNVIYGPNLGARSGGTYMEAVPSLTCAAYDWRRGEVAIGQNFHFVSCI